MCKRSEGIRKRTKFNLQSVQIHQTNEEWEDINLEKDNPRKRKLIICTKEKFYGIAGRKLNEMTKECVWEKQNIIKLQDA